MSSNYPPGVTGNEPQICGYGTEDKCSRCVEKADGEVPLAGIEDGVIEAGGEFLCLECLKELLAEQGILWSDLCYLIGGDNKGET